MFKNLLSCLDVIISDSDLNAMKKRFGLKYQDDVYIKYEAVLKSLRYDNHKEEWIITRGGNTLSRNVLLLR